MGCTRCGSTTAEGSSLCSACDPWAVPAAAGVPLAPPLPMAPQFLAADPLPKWIARAIKRNPPAPADLEKAWRNSVIVLSAMIAFWACLAVTVLAEFMQSPSSLLGVLWLLTAASMITLLVCSLAVRRNTWIPRAIAVVGTRPDIGYAGFARLRGIARITAMNGWIRGVAIGLLALRFAVNLDQSASPGARDSVYALYLFALVPLSLCQLAWQASARKELRELLGRR